MVFRLPSQIYPHLCKKEQHVRTLLLLLFPLALSAQNFTHLKLQVAFDTTQAQVLGTVQHRISGWQNQDSLMLNAVKMQFQKVLLNGQPVRYSSNDTALFVKPQAGQLHGTADTLTITYSAHPRKGLYFIGFEDTTRTAPRQIWTQGQGIDHRHWIPHRDKQTDKVIVDITARFHAAYSVVSNGSLADVRQAGSEKIWHYRMQKPMSSYLIALMIARYDSVQTRSEKGVPLTQYFYPQRADDYPWYYRYNEEIFNFLQAEIQVPYPWQNYKQAPVQDFRHGAMENTTATLFGDFFLVDSIAFNDRNYTYVNAHELAHQWFGNLVTATGSKHHWLHEGFATYYQWLSEENLYGTEFMDWERYKAAQQVFQAAQADTLPLAHPKAGSARFYQKGAWVLHMLKQKIGAEDFDEAMRQYLQQHAFALVTTDSLQAVLEEVCACDLNQFFAQWVYRPVEPALAVQERSPGKALQVAVNYTPGFALPLRFVVFYKNGPNDTLDFSTAAADSSARFTLAQNKKDVLSWELENGQHLLAYLKVFKPQERWLAQYSKSAALLNKRRILTDMPALGNKDYAQLLQQVLGDEQAHFSLRAQALELLLAQADEPETQDLLLQALRSSDVQLQKEAVYLVEKPNAQVFNRLVYLRRHGQSYQLRKEAIARTVNFDDQQANRWLYDSLWIQQPGIPGHEVHLTVLLYQILIFQDRAAFEQISTYSSNRYDFLTRIKALEIIGALRIADPVTVSRLFDALFHSNWKLNSTARRALQALNQGPNAQLIKEHRQQNQSRWNERQKRIVERTLGEA